MNVYIVERLRKREKRFGREVDVQRERPLGHVQIGKDGRIWLSGISAKQGKIARITEKAIGGVEVETETGPCPIVVVKGRKRSEE